MKIILEENPEMGKRKVTLETDEVALIEILEEIGRALLAYGFHPNSVKDAFLEIAEDYSWAEEIEEKNEKNKNLPKH